MKKLIKHWQNDKIIAATTTRQTGRFTPARFTYDVLSILKLKSFIACEQIHSNNVEFLTHPDSSLLRKNIDGSITDVKGLALVVRTADCVPLFFTDKEYNYVSLVHAGWKGTLKKIGEKTIDEFKKRGIRPDNIKVHIGPHIRQNCYEVGKEVVIKFKKHFKTNVISQKNNRYFLSLTKAIMETLLQNGALKKNITISSECTYCRNDLFFSFRREKYKSKLEYSEMTSFIYKK